MTQAEVIAEVARRARVSRPKAMRVIAALTRAIATCIEAGGEVRWRRFGTFYPKTHRARRIAAPPSAPNAGDLITLPAQVSIGFRAARAQKRKVRR